MHEQEPRLLTDHVAVQRCDRDVVRTERALDRGHFGCDHDEVARDGSAICAKRLKVDRRGHAHRRRDGHTTLLDRPSARNAHLIDTAIHPAART